MTKDMTDQLKQFPWNGKLSKQEFINKNKTQWESISSSQDLTIFNTKMEDYFRNIMIQNNFLDKMSQYVINSYEKIYGLSEFILIRIHEIAHDRNIEENGINLHNLLMNSAVNEAYLFTFRTGYHNAYDDILKTSDFFLPHVSAEVTKHYYRKIGIELSKTTLFEKR